MPALDGVQGGRVGSASASLPRAACPRPSLWHEQSSEAWWDALAIAIRAALNDRPDLAWRIAALCIAPQRETFVPVDAAGAPCVRRFSG